MMLTELKSRLKLRKAKLEGKRALLEDRESRHKELTALYEKQEAQYQDCITAAKVVKDNALTTQSELESQMSIIVTPAIKAILGKPYTFKIKFTERRGKSEADIYLKDEDGNEYSPLDNTGGGLVDILSVALRIACWRISKPQSAPIMICDEIARNLSANYVANMGYFLKEVSQRLGIQFIMVTHVEEFIEAADNVITIT